MSRSLRLGQIAGIDLYIHWTFTLLLVGIPALYMLGGSSLGEAFFGLALILTVFACVVLHELGHALTARRYDVPTRDITLYPIGGVARLTRIPEEPWREFWIAVAGPAVNLVIAIILGAYIFLTAGIPDLQEIYSNTTGHFISKLAGLNLLLVAFNLVPAFPMDGGRVLRALMASRMNYVRATQIASKIGQGTAILFGLLGLLAFNPILMFIALFVYLGAQQEEHMAMMRAVLQGVPVQEAMMTRFESLTPEMQLKDVTEILLEGSQHDFPVVDGDNVVGVLTRKEVMQALAQDGPETPVSSVMRSDFPVIDDSEMLEDAYLKINEAECNIAPIMRQGRLVGVLTMENLGEMMMISSATRQKRS